MAIFGKKKSDKDKQANLNSADSNASLSPTMDGTNPKGSAGSNIPGPGSHIRGKSSLSGPGGAGVGSGFGPSASAGGGPNNAPPSGMAGPPGAASGFKFGGPPSRSDAAGSGIPQPGSQMRSRKVSDDSSGSHAGYGMAGMGAGGGVSNGMNGPISGLPPPSGPNAGLPLGSIPNDKMRSQQVVYPWSQRGLMMNPPRFIDESRQAPPGALSPFPFPRYGHAANQTASPTGEIYLFGGLVRESVKNDLYTIYVDKLVSLPPNSPPIAPPNATQLYASATLVQTTGEIPPPRVGHATVLVSNVLILWGGDTKVRADDKQDEGLYLLNLSTREWTRVKATGDGPDSCPVGRYGHTVSIIGSKFYVFGGQVDGNFMNDLWGFDLNSLKGMPTWERITPSSDLPPKRTGHASVTYKDRIYVFGGTDGQYHYNDTWCFDVATNSWKEMSCIGYIPVPREGHATCLVDDVMYIFGGRGVDGKDLGDLASFKISNQRWYMFANMGPSPTGRSGHALAMYQNKVIVLGGESFTGVKPDDPAMIHVLDTAKIKYPPDNPLQRGAGMNTRKSSLPGGASAPGSQIQGPPGSLRGNMSPVAEEQARRAVSPTQRGMHQPPNGLVSMSQPESPESISGSQLQRQQQGMVPPQQQQQGGMQQRPPQATPPLNGEPPVRAMSPSAQTVREQRTAALHGGTQPQNMLALSQAPQQQPAPYGGPRSQRSIENMRGAGGSGATSPTTGTALRNVNGVLGRTDSPSTAPPDGFHYGRNTSPPNGGQSSLNGSGTPKGLNAELDALRKRETWLKAALAMAAKKGFVELEQLQMPDGTSAEGRSDSPERIILDGIDTGVEGSDKDRIFKALVSLKAQLANARSTIAQQAQGEANRMAESDRARSAALQEAAYYRAKLAALESGNTAEVSRLDRERAAKFEKSLADALRESAQLERQVSTLREQTKLEQQLRNSAEERLSETAKRAMAAEAAQMKAYDELSSLQKRAHATESSLREHAEQVAILSSLVARHKADHDHARSQLDSHRSSVNTHLVALTQLQAAHAAVSSRAAEYERLHGEQRNLTQQHQSTIAELKAQLDTKANEAYTHSSRVAELETLLAQHRQEAEAHRTAAAGGLAALLANKEELTTARDLSVGSVPPHVEEKMHALEEEADSLRQLHAETKQRADTHSSALQDMRERNLGLEKQHSGLRTELNAMRSQLTIALQEVARMKDVSSSKDLDLRDRTRAVEAAQVKASLLKQFMSDRGIAIPNDDELSVKSGYADRRIHELEEEIDARAREVQDAKHQLQDSESRVEELTRELEHHASRRASRGAGSDPTLLEAQQRADAAEQELAETTASYKERMAQLENDYQTAVQFVKGTEKMLRKMKDELTKYKTENSTLQSELTLLRSGNMPDDGPGAEEAARDIEALRNRLVDVTRQSEEIAAENRELERRMASLIAEQQTEHERAKEVETNHAGSSRKITDLENQVTRLETGLNDARKKVQETLELNKHLTSELAAATKDRQLGGASSSSTASDSASLASLNRKLTTAQSSNESLKWENANLTQRLHELEDKFQLLLGRMEMTHEGGEERGRDSMAYGSITSELDKWERDRSLGDNDAYGVVQPVANAEVYGSSEDYYASQDPKKQVEQQS